MAFFRGTIVLLIVTVIVQYGQVESGKGRLKKQVKLLETDISDLQADSTKSKMQVAFSGRLSSKVRQTYNRQLNRWDDQQLIKFDKVATNIGNAYSPSTGIFRCPVAGLYLFSLSIVGDTQGHLILGIKQNQEIIARPYGNGANGYETASDTAVVHANIGDEITVERVSGSSAYVDHMTRFSGVLLKAD